MNQGTGAVLTELGMEREAQDVKWGEQNHSYFGGLNDPEWEAGNHLFWAEFYKDENDFRVRQGCLGWDSILLEEVFEALAETDPAKQREELIQVAAVAVAMIECIDRKQAAA